MQKTLTLFDKQYIMVHMNTEFYTSVLRYGNNILYRGYKNGKSIRAKIPFKPTLFIAATRVHVGLRLMGYP